LIKIIILEENFKWHLEAFASELFIFWRMLVTKQLMTSIVWREKSEDRIFIFGRTITLSFEVHYKCTFNTIECISFPQGMYWNGYFYGPLVTFYTFLVFWSLFATV